ncbi:Uncharacterised protein [Vibrio cholerae]|nr:Uncharacterised protein [Vibrio cholerae]CSC21214.1 Uncharacterised protein [Vibrio cholerae]
MPNANAACEGGTFCTWVNLCQFNCYSLVSPSYLMLQRQVV